MIHDNWCHCTNCELERQSAHGIPVAARGFVYLLKSGPYYKIGKTRYFESRFDKIKLQLPFPVEVIHKIETEDPDGIETYWHRRFDEKRKNGEWFELSVEDVAIFLWRERMQTSEHVVRIIPEAAQQNVAAAKPRAAVVCKP